MLKAVRGHLASSRVHHVQVWGTVHVPMVWLSQRAKLAASSGRRCSDSATIGKSCAGWGCASAFINATDFRQGGSGRHVHSSRSWGNVTALVLERFPRGSVFDLLIQLSLPGKHQEAIRKQSAEGGQQALSKAFEAHFRSKLDRARRDTVTTHRAFLKSTAAWDVLIGIAQGCSTPFRIRQSHCA